MDDLKPSHSDNQTKPEWSEHPIKRHNLLDCMKKQNPAVSCPQESQRRHKDVDQLRVKSGKRYAALARRKAAGVAVSTPDRVDFRAEKEYYQGQRSSFHNVYEAFRLSNFKEDQEDIMC